MQTNYQFSPVAITHSPYKEKFGIPRQAGLVTEAKAQLELLSPYNDPSIIKGLETFSHLWVLFVFHAPKHEHWNPTVRPPRLGGNKRLGVFATRSPFRPNPIGMSVVKLEKIERSKGKILIHISGADLLEGTPILDIKPYIKANDIISKAQDGWLERAKDSKLRVSFSPQVSEVLKENPQLKKLIAQIIKQDPRPRYQEKKDLEESYAFKLENYDVHFTIKNKSAKITELILASSKSSEIN